MEALGSDGAAAVVGRLRVGRGLLLGAGDLVIEDVDPGEVAEEPLAGRVGAGHVLKHGHPDVLGAGLDEALVGRDAVVGRADRRVVEGLHEPDVLTGDLLDLQVGDVGVGEGLTGRVGSCEEARIAQEHVHGHVAAVGAAADVDAVAVHVRVLCKVVVDAGLEDVGVQGRVVAGAEALGGVHPHGRALDGEDIGALLATLGGEVGLDVVADEGHDLVAHQLDGDVGAAFAHAVQPDDERVGLAVDAEGLRLIGAVGEGLVARAAGRRAGEGAAAEEVGLGEEVAQGVRGGAFYGRVFLAGGLDALALLEGDLDGIGGAPGAHAAGDERGGAAGVADLQAEGEVVAAVGPLTAVVAGVDDLDVALHAVGLDGEDRRIQDVEFHFGFHDHQVDGGGGFVGGDAHDLRGHLQGLGASRSRDGQRQRGEDGFGTFHHVKYWYNYQFRSVQTNLIISRRGGTPLAEL